MSFYFSLALVIAAGVFVLRMIQIVPQQSVFVVERLGSNFNDSMLIWPPLGCHP